MVMDQLSLFQEEKSVDAEIFKSLELMKKEAQHLFTDLRNSYKELGKKQNQKIYYLDVRTYVESIREHELTDPETPRVLIRRFRTMVRGGLGYENRKNLCTQNMVTPFWALRFYSDDRADSYWFVELSRRIRSVSFILEEIRKEEVLRELKSVRNALKIICVDHLLWPKSRPKAASIFTEMEQSDYLSKLRMLTKEAIKHNWLLMGHSRQFRNDDILTNLIEKYGDKQYNAFGNDYILLNNVEFPWEQQANTVGWPEVVIPHHLLKPGEIPENICMYCKRPPNGIFNRVEIGGGKIDYKTMISLAEEFVKTMDDGGFPDIEQA